MASTRSSVSILTARQLQIMALCARGLTREEIGRELFISPATVRVHYSRIRDTLDARNITQAVTICVARGYLLVDEFEEPFVSASPELAAVA